VVKTSLVFQHSAREAFDTTETTSIPDTAEEDNPELASKLMLVDAFSLPQAFTATMHPYLQGLYREASRVQRMIRTGKLMQAWIEMPRLVRRAQLDRREFPPFTDYQFVDLSSRPQPGC
jgi:hypothetical protein